MRGRAADVIESKWPVGPAQKADNYIPTFAVHLSFDIVSQLNSGPKSHYATHSEEDVKR
jgi:hypothetical protein